MQFPSPDQRQFVDPYAAQIEELRKRMGAPQAPAYTPEQVAQRRAENEQQYALGVLGQLSGDQSLGEVGGSVLKQALAQRAPRITEKGIADPLTGEFKYDPDFLRQRDQSALDALQNRSAGARSNFDSQQNAQEERRFLQRQQLDAQAEQRREAALNRAALRGQSNGRSDFKLEDSMADDFRKETSKPQLVQQAYQGLQATAQRADPASDIAFIYQYMRILDPTSVVREGEFATAQNAAGVGDRIRNAYNNALRGTRMNPQQRTEMLGAASRLSAAAQREIEQTARNYQRTARQRGLTIQAVTPGIPELPDMSASIDVGAALGVPAGPVQRTPGGAPRAQALPKSNPQPTAGANRVVQVDY
jgi:hypothetical protein